MGKKGFSWPKKKEFNWGNQKIKLTICKDFLKRVGYLGGEVSRDFQKQVIGFDSKYVSFFLLPKKKQKGEGKKFLFIWGIGAHGPK